LIEHVLRNPSYYPGSFHDQHPRTTRSLPRLSKDRQILLIWEAMSSYLREMISQQKSVVLRKLGTFTFETSQTVMNTDPSGLTRHGYRLKLCFVLHERLKNALSRHREKHAVRRTADRSSFQLGPLTTVFLNEAPLAAGCYYTPTLVRDTLRELFNAIVELAQRGYELNLNFGVAKIHIQSQDLISVKPSSDLIFDFKDTFQMRASTRSSTPCGSSTARNSRNSTSDTWRSANLSTSMMNFLERPRSADIINRARQSRQIGILSLDMNSCNVAKVVRSGR